MPALLRAVAAALIAVAVAPALALAHEGSSDYRSIVRTPDPAPGVRFSVLNYDDRMLAVNDGRQALTIIGYDSEPYARLLPDGTVQVNQRSPAAYLNDDRFGGAKLPPQADGKAAPQWKTIDRTGRFEWHDHRMHYMAKGRPPAVTSPDKRTKVFDYRIPIRLGAGSAAVRGELVWVGQPKESFPLVPVLIGGLAVLASLLLAVVLIRRRLRGTPDADDEVREAW